MLRRKKKILVCIAVHMPRQNTFNPYLKNSKIDYMSVLLRTVSVEQLLAAVQ